MKTSGSELRSDVDFSYVATMLFRETQFRESSLRPQETPVAYLRWRTVLIRQALNGYLLFRSVARLPTVDGKRERSWYSDAHDVTLRVRHVFGSLPGVFRRKKTRAFMRGKR